jgi:hypothetical protein
MSAPPSNDVEDRGGGGDVGFERPRMPMDDKSAAAALLMRGEERVVNFFGGEVEDVFGYGEEVTLNFPPL